MELGETKQSINFAGRYHIQNKIGRGAAAEVFHAIDIHLGRPVALKLLRAEYSEDSQFMSRFRNEARAVARLSHPNIVTVYDYSSHEDQSYIVMEYMPGPDLKAYLAEHGPLPEDEVRSLGSQILVGLGAAHALGIIHRDMKPHNVFLSSDGNPKVGDFGISKATGEPGLTSTGMVFGTPHYFAPELASGKGATFRSDLYAIGVMLYEMLSGRLPFERESMLAVIHAHAFEEPPPLSELVPGISPGMLAVVQSAMAKDPAQRFASTREMADALAATEAQVSSPPPQLRPVPAPQVREERPPADSTPFWRRRVPVVPLLLLLGLLGFIAAYLSGDDSNAGRTPATAIGTASPERSAAGLPTVAAGGTRRDAPTRERTPARGEASAEVTVPPTDEPRPTQEKVIGADSEATAITAEPTQSTRTPDPTATATSPPAATAVPDRAPDEAVAVLYASSPQGDGLNLRERPSGASPLVTTVPPGEQVRSLGPAQRGADGGRWREATYNGQTGYLAASLLRPTRRAALGNSFTRPASSNGAMFRGNLRRTGDYDAMGMEEFGSVAWRFETGDGVSRGITAALGVAYFGSVDNYFYAVDARTGKQKWRFRTGGIPSASPAVAGKLVYFGSDDGFVYALDRETGRQAWAFDSGDRVPSAPAVANGVVYFGSWNTYLHAVDAASGKELWRFKTGGRIASSPAIASGTVFIGSDDTYLYAVDIRTRQLRWRFKTRQRVYASPAVNGGSVYFGSHDGTLYAADAATGDARWQFETGGKISSSAAVAEGRVYFGSYDGRLRALDAATGELEWEVVTGGDLFSSPAVSGNTVYFGGGDTALYAVDTATGDRRWRYRIGSPIQGSPEIYDRTIIIGALDGGVYALR
ncbi:MAG: PQQ-binding-like beta-propeller repeat protein [Chloroflexota bacterium]|nr:PQQ-binding-like beta-propeller repeat protein [Chloroflexota bacterium]